MRPYKTQISVGGLVLTERERQLVHEVLESNQLTYGPMTKKFENMFAASHGANNALFMNSGTSALHVALGALKSKYMWEDGAEVIIPSVTFVATANIVLHNRMKPVFVDVDPLTYNIDPNKIEKKITKSTKVIIPVHLLGLPADMDAILEIAGKYNLRIIEDSCETMFAKVGKQMVGSIGDIGCFSTYVAHFLVTGVGGFAITNQEDLATRMRSLMNHGRDSIYTSSLDYQNGSKQKKKEIIEKRFSFVEIGHSFRCTELESAIGIGQLERANEIIEKRKKIANCLNEGLAEIEEFIQLPSCPTNRTHSYMLYGVLLKKGDKRELVNYLEQLNIETRDLLPLVNQPIYRKLYGEDLEDQFPVAKNINNNGFYIGCHPYMTDSEVSFIVDAFKNYFKS
jgi:dTDP-4-amino-4,6-dideoxygalactose transaminase